MIEKLEAKLEVLETTYMALKNTPEMGNYSNGALDVIWAIKNFIQVNNK